MTKIGRPTENPWGSWSYEFVLSISKSSLQREFSILLNISCLIFLFIFLFSFVALAPKDTFGLKTQENGPKKMHVNIFKPVSLPSHSLRALLSLYKKIKAQEEI